MRPSERIERLKEEYYRNNIFQEEPVRVITYAIIRYLDEQYESQKNKKSEPCSPILMKLLDRHEMELLDMQYEINNSTTNMKKTKVNKLKKAKKVVKSKKK